jgi:high-affinity nickel-transport protein
MAGELGLGLVALGVGLGLRHGIDWDHIAAITDVTSAQPSRLRGLAMGTLYAIGHAVVVVALGLLAIWAATLLPEGIDGVMERVVGVTLLFLAGWVFWSLVRKPDQFVLRSRWMLLFAAVRSAYRWAISRLTGRTYPAGEMPRTYGALLSLGIGMIHGIGAETGSQALLFASAAGAATAIAGSVLLISFAVGLLVSNTFITVGSTMGILGAQARRVIYLAIGVVIGLFSLIIGTFFVLGKGSLLPGFFA